MKGRSSAAAGVQRTLGIIKPDIVIPSLPSLFHHRTPPITLDLLLRTPPHLLLSSSSSPSTSSSSYVSSSLFSSPSSSSSTAVCKPTSFLEEIATDPSFESVLRRSFPSLPTEPGQRTPLEVVLELIAANGFEIVTSRFMEMTIEQAERFYGEHEGRFFYQRLVAFMTSGPIVPIVLAKQDAIAQWRALMGPTHIQRARLEAPNSIRGRFAMSDTRNSTHGSDSVENARKEIAFFFPELEPLTSQ